MLEVFVSSITMYHNDSTLGRTMYHNDSTLGRPKTNASTVRVAYVDGQQFRHSELLESSTVCQGRIARLWAIQ